MDEIKSLYINGVEYVPKQQSTEQKDYEIILFEGVYFKDNSPLLYSKDIDGMFSHGIPTISENKLSEQRLIERDAKIKSVRRLSDNEVFSIGGNTQFGIIKGFYINTDIESYDKGNMMVYFDTPRANRALYELKANKPLFTTTDGVDIFEGDDYWRLNDEFCYYRVSNPNYSRGGSEKYFSTKEAAKEHVLMNKPCLSLKDVLSEYSDDFGYFKTKIRQIVEEHLNK